jgi:hypothetical protein
MGSRLRTRMGWMAVWAGTWLVATAAEPIAPDQFDQLRQKIKPQAGESRFWEIPWLLSLDEALVKAAQEGKPIFVWSGAGGPPHTVC